MQSIGIEHQLADAAVPQGLDQAHGIVVATEAAAGHPGVDAGALEHFGQGVENQLGADGVGSQRQSGLVESGNRFAAAGVQGGGRG